MKKRIISLVALLLLISLTAACSAANAAPESSPYSGGMNQPMASSAPEPSFSSEEAGGEAAYDTSYDMAEADRGGGNGGSDPQRAAAEGLKIIYTAYAEIQTETFRESYDQLLALLSGAGGYIQNSDVSGGYTSDGGHYRHSYAQLVFRVPAGGYEAFLDGARGIGTVTNLNEYTDDITSEYIDTGARLVALKTQEKRLLELMSQAELITDLIEIESKLSDVRYQIESFQSQMNAYDKLLDYSTVTVSLTEVSSVTLPQDTFGQRISAAFRGSGDAVVRFLKDALITLIYALPLLALALAAALIVRSVLKKSAARRAEQRARAPQAAFQTPCAPPPAGGDLPSENKR